MARRPTETVKWYLRHGAERYDSHRVDYAQNKDGRWFHRCYTWRGGDTLVPCAWSWLPRVPVFIPGVLVEATVRLPVYPTTFRPAVTAEWCPA